MSTYRSIRMAACAMTAVSLSAVATVAQAQASPNDVNRPRTILTSEQGAAQLPSRLTLGDIVASVILARRITAFEQEQPRADSVLMSQMRLLTNSKVLDKPLQDVAGRAERPGFLARAKERQRVYEFDLPDSLPVVLNTIVTIVNGEMRGPLEQRASPAELSRIRAPFDSLQDAQLARSLTESAEKLRRFEVKYGPGSVKLNGAEAALNYLAQWVPGFGVDARGWPEPLEMIAAMTPAYITSSNGKARALTVAEAGVRLYVFGGADPADKGWRAILRPRHIAVGWAFTSADDETLRNPLRAARTGPFVSVGELKVAYVYGGNARLLVSRQFRFVPLLF